MKRQNRHPTAQSCWASGPGWPATRAMLQQMAQLVAARALLWRARRHVRLARRLGWGDYSVLRRGRALSGLAPSLRLVSHQRMNAAVGDSAAAVVGEGCWQPPFRPPQNQRVRVHRSDHALGTVLSGRLSRAERLASGGKDQEPYTAQMRRPRTKWQGVSCRVAAARGWPSGCVAGGRGGYAVRPARRRRRRRRGRRPAQLWAATVGQAAGGEANCTRANAGEARPPQEWQQPQPRRWAWPRVGAQRAEW